jgi:hypothetical protein
MKSKETIPEEVLRLGSDAVTVYRNSLAAGGSPAFALMCATQTPPGAQGTDRTLMEGRYGGAHMDALPERQAAWMLREAKAAGISTKGKVYHGGIADKRGHRDPEAWIDSAADILRVAKKRNLEVRGAVNYTPPEAAGPPKSVDLNPKLVRQLARREMAENPGLKKEDAIARVKERHVPHWKRKAR